MTFTFRTVARRGGAAAPPGGPRRRAGNDRARDLARHLRRLTLLDVAIAAAVLVGLLVLARLGRDPTVSFRAAPEVAGDPGLARLPNDAARTLLRMFVALGASYAFALAYGKAAASNRRAERILVPILDVLQSVPVLGFLTVTTTVFLSLFPGSVLGLELVAIFAIFTAQAWNLAFSFHASLQGTPRELTEMTRLLGLSRWRRFWTLEVPDAAHGLIWNGMMSMGGGWFFLVASEAISVGGVDHALPGVGSYTGAAIRAGDLGAVGWAIATMTVLVLGVNVLFWRPLVAWSERFRHDETPAELAPRSLVLDLLRRSHWPRAVGRLRRRGAEPLNRLGDRLLGTDRRPLDTDRGGTGARVLDVAAHLAIAVGLVWFLRYVTEVEGWRIFLSPFGQGLLTLARVVVVVVASTVVWVPIGVRIGLDPRLSRVAQPLVQLLASFPANFLFPVAVWAFLRTGLSIEVGGVVLMALGAQWYVLFNAVAGAQAIPNDLREAADDLGVRGWLRWRRLYLPAVLPAYVTGGITASGGAWNASIVSEVVTYGTTTLTATGLGAYITEATERGDAHRLLAGIAVMAVYVVGLNRLVWHPLGRLAARRTAGG